MSPKIKTAALFLAVGVAVVLTGVVLGWGASKVLSGLRPVSFFVLSNAASAIESFSQRFAPGAELVVQPERKADDAPMLLVPDMSTAAPSEEGRPDETPQTANKSASATVALPKQAPPTSPKKNLPSFSSAITTTNSTPQTGVKTEKTFVYYSTGPTASDPQGMIDLEPRILEIGFVDKTTNVFTASSSPSANLRVAVRFEVVNTGTKDSGAWSFNAVLPTMPLYIYSGDAQQSLLPGEKIEFVIGFDSVERKKDGELIVNVDPTSRVVESNESNNIVRTLINPIF